MPNVQFEQEQQYVPIIQKSVPPKSRPWFIRLIFAIGLASNESVANVISLVAAVGIIALAVTLFMKLGSDSSLPKEFQNITSYRQDIYRDF